MARTPAVCPLRPSATPANGRPRFYGRGSLARYCYRHEEATPPDEASASVYDYAASIGNRGQVNYAAAKGALNAATKALSLELASRGITVNAVAPGIIAAGMTIGFDAKLSADLVPMKRVGTPDEAANLVAFLTSDAAS